MLESDLGYRNSFDRRIAINWRLLFGIALLALVAVQLIMGGDIICIFLIICSIIIGLVPVASKYTSSSTRVLFMWIVFFYSVSALVIKTILWQTVQSNLFEPRLSFSIGVVGIFAAVVAVLAQGMIFYRFKPIFKPLNTAGLQYMLYISIGLGAFSAVAAKDPGALGRLAALLGGFVFIPIIIAVQLNLRRTNGRKSLSIGALLLLCFGVLISIANNTKLGVIGVCVAYFATLALHRASLKKREWVVLALAGSILVFIVSPAINLVRNARELGASSTEMVTLTMTHLWDVLDPTENISQALSTQIDDEALLYTVHYFSYETAAIDRIAFVPYIDAIVRFVGNSYTGYSFVTRNLGSIIPNPFNAGQKEIVGNGDLVLREFGVGDSDAASMLTFPIFGEGYVADGFSGVFVLTFIAYFFLSIFFNTILGSIRENPIAIYVIAIYAFALCGSGLVGLLFFVFRVAPIYIFVHLLCQSLAYSTRSRVSVGVA